MICIKLYIEYSNSFVLYYYIYIVKKCMQEALIKRKAIRHFGTILTKAPVAFLFRVETPAPVVERSGRTAILGNSRHEKWVPATKIIRKIGSKGLCEYNPTLQILYCVKITQK